MYCWSTNGINNNVCLRPLGCYNRILRTGWLTNNENLFLTLPEAGKSKSRLPADQVSDESSLPDSQSAVFSLRPRKAEGAGEPSGVLYRSTNLFMRALSLGPDHCPNAPPPNTITLAVRISTHEFQRGSQAFRLWQYRKYLIQSGYT